LLPKTLHFNLPKLLHSQLPLTGGLVNDAIKKGYRAYFTTMADLIGVLNRKEIISSAMSTYKRYTKAHLIAIDDIMMFPVQKSEAVALFNLINHLHEQCSIIITTNKSPSQWAETLDDGKHSVMPVFDSMISWSKKVDFQKPPKHSESIWSF